MSWNATETLEYFLSNVSKWIVTINNWQISTFLSYFVWVQGITKHKKVIIHYLSRQFNQALLFSYKGRFLRTNNLYYLIVFLIYFVLPQPNVC